MRSPGKAISERARLESQLTAATLRELRVFLAAVERDAAGALNSPVVLAALDGEDWEEWDEEPEPFTLGRVERRWQAFVLAMLAAFPFVYATSTVLQRISDMLRLNPLPEQAYASARAVLTAGVEQLKSKEAVRQELSTALSMQTGTSQRVSHSIEPEGINWEDQARRLARTTATSTYGLASVLGMPAGSEKRWVAVGDKFTRKTHSKASGQTVPVDQAFMVGSAALQYPGDPSGPRGETMNCRCVVVQV